MGVKFTIHSPPGSSTKDVTIRISSIDNGFVVKAGGKPYYCTSPNDLWEKIGALIDEFAAEVAKDEPPETLEQLAERRLAGS